MTEINNRHLFSGDNILGVSEHETEGKLFITSDSSVSLVNVSSSESESTWSEANGSSKFTTPAVQFGQSLFAVLSHKTFVEWKIKGSLKEGKKATSKSAVAQLHSSPLLQGHILVVFCNGSVSLLNASSLEIVEQNEPSSVALLVELSQLIPTKKSSLLLFILAKKKESYVVCGYKISPSDLSLNLKYAFEVPQSTNAVITSCSFDRLGFGIQWNTGFWERYNIIDKEFTLVKTFLISTPTVLSDNKGKKKLDQAKNETVSVETQAFVHPSTLITLNAKDGVPSLSVWNTSFGLLQSEQKIPTTSKGASGIKQLFRSRDGKRLFIVLEKEVIQTEGSAAEITLADVIGKKEQKATPKPALSTVVNLFEYLQKQNKTAGGKGTVEIEIDDWKEEIEKKDFEEEKVISSLLSLTDVNQLQDRIKQYLQKLKVHPSYHFLQTVLNHSAEKGFWEAVRVLLSSKQVTRRMAPTLIPKLIEKKNISLICSVLTHMKNIPSADVVSLLRFFLLPESEALIRNHFKTEESLYFLLNLLMLVPLQSIPEIEELTEREATLLLTFFQTELQHHFAHIYSTDSKETLESLQQAHTQQSLTGIIFWLSSLLDSKFISLISTQQSFSIMESIQIMLNHQVAIGLGLASVNGPLSYIKASVEEGSKTLLMSKSYYTIETWPN
eukprot:TRINITY_DN4527_c0_g1_i1.p1 TRINITY_DN4527_c0_g1~~TRINITY_DN4527_c0_g1_i1.p1  ORF type:complete len:669 (-),score=135.53 TRINITY_DN4527_c0_g1_i1:56-2062(-)